MVCLWVESLQQTCCTEPKVVPTIGRHLLWCHKFQANKESSVHNFLFKSHVSVKKAVMSSFGAQKKLKTCTFTWKGSILKWIPELITVLVKRYQEKTTIPKIEKSINLFSVIFDNTIMYKEIYGLKKHLALTTQTK